MIDVIGRLAVFRKIFIITNRKAIRSQSGLDHAFCQTVAVVAVDIVIVLTEVFASSRICRRIAARTVQPVVKSHRKLTRRAIAQDLWEGRRQYGKTALCVNPDRVADIGNAIQGDLSPFRSSRCGKDFRTDRLDKDNIHIVRRERDFIPTASVLHRFHLDGIPGTVINDTRRGAGPRRQKTDPFGARKFFGRRGLSCTARRRRYRTRRCRRIICVCRNRTRFIYDQIDDAFRR